MGLARRLEASVVLLPLLAALLSQGLKPHLHAIVESGHHLHAQQQECHEAGATLEAECLICRSGSQLRTGLVPTGSFHAPAESGPSLRFVGSDAASIASRLVRAASPPRAPPV
jgi:hypothetical protein